MIDPLTMMEAAMLGDTERLRVTGHNLANTGTLAFKREIALMRPGFEAALQSSAALIPSAPITTTAVDGKGGALRLTSNPLDVALEGDGFFVLAGPSGPVYTRQGNFQLDPRGRLVGVSGYPVMGDAGEIVLPSADPRIDAQGNVWDGQNPVSRLRVVSFENASELESLGAGVFSAANAASSPVENVNIRQGFVEVSNISAMHEMVKLIEIMRHFEASQRMLKAYDAMNGTALSTLGTL